MLGHLGWVQFSNEVSVNTHREFSLVILMTIAPMLDEGVSSLSFCLKGVEQVVPYEYIRELLDFPKGTLEQVDVHGGTLEQFWSMIAGEAHRQRNERDQDNRNGDELALLGFIARQPVDPTHLMINRWCCEATSGLGDTGSGCYLSMLAISLRPGIPRNPEHLLVGTSLGFEYMKQGKYISGEVRGGFKVDKVNLPLLDVRLRLFSRGERGLVRGRTSCAGEEK
jgi:hypothetical protein